MLQELQRAERLTEEIADKLRTWNPSGFDVFAGRQVSMGESKRIEEMGRYMTRPPLAQDAVENMPDGRVLIPTPPDPRSGAPALQKSRDLRLDNAMKNALTHEFSWFTVAPPFRRSNEDHHP